MVFLSFCLWQKVIVFIFESVISSFYCAISFLIPVQSLFLSNGPGGLAVRIVGCGPADPGSNPGSDPLLFSELFNSLNNNKICMEVLAMVSKGKVSETIGF